LYNGTCMTCSIGNTFNLATLSCEATCTSNC
jgi:hypothetical protein